MNSTRVLPLLALLLAFATATSRADESRARVEFFLAPETFLNSEDLQDHLLPEGEVFLYREGSFEPELTANLSEPIAVPRGTWFTIATAPGWVSTSTGTLHLPDSPETGELKELIGVAPACNIALAGGPEAWRGMDRVDFVSIEYGAVYPVTPGNARPIRLPVGSFLLYTMSGSRLNAMAGPFACRANTLEKVAAPIPPDPGRHTFMVHTPYPENLDTKAFDATLRPLLESRTTSFFPGHSEQDSLPSPAIAPTTHTLAGGRASWFFLDVPVGNQRFHLEHPNLRSLDVSVLQEDQAVRDMGVHALSRRRALTWSVDYQPVRSHEEARIDVFHCGLDPSCGIQLDKSQCRDTGISLPLQEGVGEYRVDDLEDGQIMLVAEVDDEEIPHLNGQYCPYLDPETDEPPEDPGILTLRELHIYGNLLFDDEPVVGEVQLVPRDEGLSPRRFPTDERLEYNLYYFGRRFEESSIPKLFPDLGSSDRSKLFGMYGRDQIRACSAEACRFYHVFSTLAGEGRLDLDLGNANALEVRVGSAAKREPLPEALVSLGIRPKELRFYHGEVREEQIAGREGQTQLADEEGRATFRNLPIDQPVPLQVRLSGFKSHREKVKLEEGSNVVEVWLEEEDDTGTLARFYDGSPAVGGAFLGRRAGQLDFRCIVVTNSLGRLQVPDSCATVDDFLFLHPAATIERFDARDVALVAEVEVSRPMIVPEIRLVDANGSPIPGVGLGLRFGDFDVTSVDVSAAASLSLQQPLFFQTDARGRARLYGVDMSGVVVPDLLVELGEGPISGPLIGEVHHGVIDIVLPVD